jgi:hypothetical protein
VQAASDDPAEAVRQIFLKQDPRVVMDALLGGDMPTMPRISVDF